MAELLGPSAPGIRTKTTYSLQIVVYDNEGKPIQIGTASELTPTHRRTNTVVGGVGIGDRRIELVPGRSGYTLRLSKFAIWDKTFYEIFGFNPDVRMLAEMQKPFDIIQIHINPNDPNDVRETYYRKCVINNWSRTQRWADDVTITDSVDVDVTSIDDGDPSMKDLGSVF